MARLLRPTLAAYLRRQAREPFEWGRTDCALFVADWAIELTGIDGASALRGRYGTEASANAMHGPFGLVRTVDRCARAAGLARVSDHRDGDVGAVVVDDRVVCGIRINRKWAVRGDRSIWAVSPSRIVAVWGLRGEMRNG